VISGLELVWFPATHAYIWYYARAFNHIKDDAMSSLTTVNPAYRSGPGQLHAILLAGTVPLFLGALLSDIAYYQTYQIQWSNFASWLIAGAMVFCGFALLFSLINLVRAPRKGGQPLVYFLVLLATFVLGLINAFQHAKDAWAVMPSGLVLSVIVAVLAFVAAWIGLTPRTGGAQ
jgi:uncharacterized membrane protein